MRDIETGRQRFQFGLRKLLLWTVAVALGCGLLSSLQLDAIDWLLLLAWFFVVLAVRWASGHGWAATASVVLGMLLLLVRVLLYYGWALSRTRPSGLTEHIDVVTVLLVGALMGFVAFLLTEATYRTLNWVDRIAEPDE